MNINDITAEQVGLKFIEWLKLEREYQKTRQGLYFQSFHDDSDDDDFHDRNTPTDKKQDIEATKKMLDALRRQLDTYKELYELADLYIAKELS